MYIYTYIYIFIYICVYIYVYINVFIYVYMYVYMYVYVLSIFVFTSKGVYNRGSLPMEKIHRSSILTDSTENAASPKSTKSRNSHSLVQI